MRRILALAVVVALTACGGGTDAVENEMAAATFVVTFPAVGAEVRAFDRLATASEIENRLEVIRPDGEGVGIEAVYASALVPDPFEFVRDPLAVGSLAAFLDGAETVVAVLHPLINPTPNGRVLTGSLVAIDADGAVLRTDWGPDGDGRIRNLVAWGAGHGFDAAASIRSAVFGLTGTGTVMDEEAAALITG